MTQDQFIACKKLDNDGWTQLKLPHRMDTPIPGLMLFTKSDHQQLLLVQPDGSTVDLLALHRAAEDLIRNWGKGTTVPKFIGDWRRLILVANVLNGGDPDALREPK